MVDNIKMELGGIGRADISWIVLAQDREKWWDLVNAVINLQVLSNAEKLSRGSTTNRLPNSAQIHRIS
jgi:ketosteroid isomerase-like protein